MAQNDKRPVGWIQAASTVLLVIVAFAIWLPTSWKMGPRSPQGSFTEIGIGPLRPLGVVWESWPEGVQFRVVEVRTLPLIASGLLTFAAQLAARRCYQHGRQPAKHEPTGEQAGTS